MTIIHPKWIWTPDGLATGWCVKIHSGRIVGVHLLERHHEVDISLPNSLLVPGFVNAHSHAFQRGFRGKVQWTARARDDFWSWRDEMYRLANRLPPEGVEDVSRLAFLEMAEAGVTQVGEFHYLHHQSDGTPYDNPTELAERVIAAARDVGIRICLLRVAYARGGPGKGIEKDQRRFCDKEVGDVYSSIERLERLDDPMVTVGLAPHSVRALSAEWLTALSEYQGVVHMHVSEQPGENRACSKEYGVSPLQRIQDSGLLTDRFCAVHLTHPMAGDLELLKTSGGRICVCPSTELDLGDGFLPVEAREEIPMCVGSDSQATIDMMAEAAMLEMHGRGVAGRRNVLSPPGNRHGLAARLLNAITIQGQIALGEPGLGIEVGAPADLVGIRLDRPGAWGVPPLEAAVFNGNPDWVSSVWVGGKQIVHQGRHPARERVWQAASRWMQPE
jgi:formimidoylglutamate deiminase